MKHVVKKGQTSYLVAIFIQDSSSTTGAGLTGLTSGSSGLVCYRARSDDGNAAGTQITLSAGTRGTWSSGGFVEKDATNMPGVYELGIPDAALATGSNYAIVMLKGATNMAPLPIEFQLVAYDPLDSVHLGLSAIPNATAGAANGLVICGTNAPVTITGSGDALTITSTGGNGNGINISGNGSGDGFKATGGATGRGMHAIGGATSGAGFRIEGTAGNANAIEAQGQGSSDGIAATGGATGRGLHCIGGATSGAGIMSIGGASGANGVEVFGAVTGTGVGLQITGGGTGSGVAIIGGGTSGNGVSITTTSGDGLSILPTAGNGIVATANGTSKHGAVITGGTAGTSDGVKAVAGTGGVDIRGNITGNVTGNLSGSAGSVTGSVGSVTGNVGGNVVGSVASVTARVTANTDQWAGGTIPAPNVTGVPLIDLKYTLGTVSPATAGSVRADAVTGAVGSVTGNVGGNVVGSVGSVVATVAANLTQILGTALTETAGQIAAAFKQWFNVAAPTGTVNSIPNAVAGASGGLFIAGSNAATTVNFTGSLSGSVGSVTGAVGSVTGNVGGNVTGSVGSVVGAVGSVTAGVTVTTNNDKAGYDITSNVKKNTAQSAFAFLMTDATTHAPKTGLTITSARSIDGAAFAACANAATEISNGWYTIALAAADVNGNDIALRFTAAGADDCAIKFKTQP